MQQWHTLEGSGIHAKTAGPFTREAMEGLARNGVLAATTIVARVGATSWSAAGDDAELVALFRETPPQYPLFNTVAPAPLRYSFSAAFGLAWTTFTGQWGLLVLIGLAYIVCAVAINIPFIIGMFMVQVGGWGNVNVPLFIALAVFTWIISLLLGTPLLAGALYAGIRAVRKELRFEDLKAGFRRFGAVLGTGLVAMLCMLALLIIPYGMAISGVIMLSNASGASGLAAGGIILAIVGYLLTLALSLPAGVVFMLTLMAVVDPQVNAAGGMPAVKTGIALAKNNLPSLCGFFFVLYLIMTFSMYACGVGFILLGMPLLLTGLGAAYELLRAQRSAATA